MDEFYEIEQQRKRKVNEMIQNVINEREESNKEMIQNVINGEERRNTTLINEGGDVFNKSGIFLTNESAQDRESKEIVKDPFTNYSGNINYKESQDYISKEPQDQFNKEIQDRESKEAQDFISKEVKDQFSKDVKDQIIEESPALNFNIKLTDHYKKTFIHLPEYLQIEERIKEEKSRYSKYEILDLKKEVNKRLNQLNSDFNKIITLSKFLEKYRKSYIFVEIFTLKILEQSTIQVSRYHESYKQYALFFKLLFSEDLFIFYKFNLFNKKGCNCEGLYAVFFGILKECELTNEIWAFAAGFLNTENSEFVVLEMYLKILGEYLLEVVGDYSKKLFRYIKKYSVNNVKNPAQKYKIEKMIDDLLQLK